MNPTKYDILYCMVVQVWRFSWCYLAHRLTVQTPEQIYPESFNIASTLLSASGCLSPSILTVLSASDGSRKTAKSVVGHEIAKAGA